MYDELEGEPIPGPSGLGGGQGEATNPQIQRPQRVSTEGSLKEWRVDLQRVDPYSHRAQFKTTEGSLGEWIGTPQKTPVRIPLVGSPSSNCHEGDRLLRYYVIRMFLLGETETIFTSRLTFNSL